MSRSAMAWRSTYREQYLRESRYVVLANAVELVALIGIAAGLVAWMA
jgi:hypothetical protein